MSAFPPQDLFASLPPPSELVAFLLQNDSLSKGASAFLASLVKHEVHFMRRPLFKGIVSIPNVGLSKLDQDQVDVLPKIQQDIEELFLYRKHHDVGRTRSILSGM
jgi:hypothetical protein